MKDIRTTRTSAALLAVLPFLLTQISALALAGTHTSLTANVGAAFPSFYQSLFPVVGLIAAVAFTQLLHRRRVLQLKALPIDRS